MGERSRGAIFGTAPRVARVDAASGLASKADPTTGIGCTRDSTVGRRSGWWATKGLLAIFSARWHLHRSVSSLFHNVLRLAQCLSHRCRHTAAKFLAALVILRVFD